MPDFERMYFRLFNALSDIINALEENRTVEAYKLAVAAQQESEKIYIGEETD